MKDATDITIVLDRSGSMESIRQDTIGGLNQFIEEQQKLEGECTLTVVQFDGQDPQYVQVSALPIKEVEKYTTERFKPRGSTPLYDALGQAIENTGRRLAAIPIETRPDKVLFVVITDGEENASREFNRQRVFDLIKHQSETYKWEFIYLGANQDAMTVGMGMGMNAGNTMSYAANKVGTRNTYAIASAMGGAHRRGAKASSVLNAEVREAAMGNLAPEDLDKLLRQKAAK